jgi:repressor LexA
MSGRVQYLCLVALKPHDCAVGKALIRRGRLGRSNSQPACLLVHDGKLRKVGFVHENRRAGQLFQPQRSTHVVNVPMGYKNLLQGQTELGQTLVDAADLVAGIDDDGFMGLLIAHQRTITRQRPHGKRLDDHAHHCRAWAICGETACHAACQAINLPENGYAFAPLFSLKIQPLKKSCCNSLFIRYNARMAVTRRQKEVIDFLETFVSRNGYSPSFEEIARGMGLKSLATVHKHITNLEKKGLLDRVHNRSRSIDLLPPGSRTRSSARLPLAGRIAAGLPVEAIENQETISLHDVVGNRDVFALEVRGDSMRDEHIISGDYVLVERTRTARQGEIVVALVRGAETTLKRFFNEGSVVRLQPANAEMDPIYVPAAQVAIQGRVLGVLRKYR